MFTHLDLPKIPKLEQINKDGKRHYEKDGKRYPSVTRVLSIIGRDGIKRWRDYVGEVEADRISSESMAVGTALHETIEASLKNEKLPDLKGDFAFSPHELFTNLMLTLSDIDNIKAQEVRLYSDKMELAGTADCIAEYEGVPSIIDFKNSRKRKTKSYILKYFVQATAYSLMWEELTGQKISQIVIMVAGWDGSVEVFKEDRSNYIEKLWETLLQYEKERVI